MLKKKAGPNWADDEKNEINCEGNGCSQESCKVCLTLKGVALLSLVEAGVIQRDEDGCVDADGFERFWCKFERNLEIAMDNAMAELSARYKDAQNTNRTAGQRADHRAYDGNLGVKNKLVVSALLILFFFFAFLFIGR